MPSIIETTSNKLFRVVEDMGAHYDCVPVKRTKHGYADTAKARMTLINKQFVWKIHA